jgi:hypothetical protein
MSKTGHINFQDPRTFGRKKGRRSSSAVRRVPVLHRSMHRPSMERDWRHYVAGQGVGKILPALVVIAAGSLILLAMYGAVGVPDPHPQPSLRSTLPASPFQLQH